MFCKASPLAKGLVPSFLPRIVDIQAILGDDELLVKLHEAVKRRNLENGVAVTAVVREENCTILVTEFNQLSDGRFFDPDSGVTVSLNHYNLEVEEVVEEEAEQRRCDDSLRLALKRALQGYISQTLPGGEYQVFFDREKGEYGIVMVGERFQLANMRNGQWRAVWRYSPASETIVGEVRVIVHYFEDGNVQLNAKRGCEMELKTPSAAEDEESTADKIAKEVVAKVRSREDEIQLAINDAYSQLSETTFKRLRRQLPVTRSKVDWYNNAWWEWLDRSRSRNKLASYKVGDQLPSSH